VPDLILAIGDWWAGVIDAVRGLWNRMTASDSRSRDAEVRTKARRRTHGMRSKPKQEGDR
jgi:hypothetical protein